jgi:hypothetical protein
MPTIVINGTRVTVGDEFLSLPQAEQHKAIDEIAAKIGAKPAAPTREQESQAELARLNKMVADKGTPADGMPAPRAPSAFEQSEFYQRTKRAPEILSEVVRPEDIGANVETMAQQAADFGKAGSDRFVAGLSNGRPLDVVTGAGQNILGGMGIAFAPISGATKTFIADPLSRTFGRDVGERAQVVADIAAGPGMITAAAKPVVGASNMLVSGANKVQGIFQPKMNWLGEAVGEQGPDIVNLLRTSTSGVEGAGQAAAPARSVSFSQFAKELEKFAPQIADDAAATQDALLAARSNIAEGRMAEGSRKLADVVAAPNEQDIGKNLIAIAEKEKRAMKDTVMNPAFKKPEEIAGGAKTSIKNTMDEAFDLIDTIDPDAAAIISRRLGKFKSETTTSELIGPGGATYKGESITTPPMATLTEIGDIRSAINSASAKAKATGDEDGFRRLSRLHSKLDQDVTTSASLPPEAVAAYKDALRIYATEYAPRFKTGLQFDLFKVRQGVNAIKPENVVDKFFNSPTSTDQFIALYGGNRDAMLNAKVGIEGLFRDKAIKDGVIDTKAANKFLDDYSAQIDKLDARGLGIRDKLTSLVDETARVTVPESRIAEARGAIKGGTPSKGTSAEKIGAQVDELVKATSAEDLTMLRDAVEVARRRGEFETQAATPVAKEFKLPSAPPVGTDFLNLAYRIPIEVYRRVTGKLTSDAAQRLGELLSDPKRLNEAADLIEKAIAMKARQAGRKLGPVNAPSYAGVPSAVVNTLAPTPQNNLAYPAGQ